MRKKCSVVALPTENRSKLVHNNLAEGFFFGGGNVLANTRSGNCTNYHLYLISDDEIEIGDHAFIPRIAEHVGLKIEKVHTSAQASFMNRKQWKKVIASTDTSLNLPAIPEWFIKEYAEKQASEVLVEEKTATGTMIDPNQGHQYGFPKLYCGVNPSLSEIKDFISENGYPIEEYINCRCWEVEVKQLEFHAVFKDKMVIVRIIMVLASLCYLLALALLGYHWYIQWYSWMIVDVVAVLTATILLYTFFLHLLYQPNPQ